MQGREGIVLGFGGALRVALSSLVKSSYTMRRFLCLLLALVQVLPSLGAVAPPHGRPRPQYGTVGMADGVVTSENHQYLVDTSQPYAEVIQEAEWVGNALPLITRYDIGLDRLRMFKYQVTSNGPPPVFSPVLSGWYLFDGLGSTRAVVDDSGVGQSEFGYGDAFGIPYQVAANGTRATAGAGFFLNGQQWDGSGVWNSGEGLYFNRARYYQPGLGRFIGQDILLGNSSSPISQHRFIYGGNDSVNHIDPSGNEFSLGGMISTIASSSILRGMVFSAAISGVDTAIDKGANATFGDILGAQAMGAGMSLLPVGLWRFKALRPLIALTGAGMTAVGLGSAALSDRWDLFTFRAATTIGMCFMPKFARDHDTLMQLKALAEEGAKNVISANKPKKLGPAYAAGKDMRTGKIIEGEVNSGKPDASGTNPHVHGETPDPLHPLLEEKLSPMEAEGYYRALSDFDGVPGTHAEIWVINKLLWARGANCPRSALQEIAVYTVRTNPNYALQPFDRCDNCRDLSDGVWAPSDRMTHADNGKGPAPTWWSYLLRSDFWGESDYWY